MFLCRTFIGARIYTYRASQWEDKTKENATDGIVFGSANLRVLIAYALLFYLSAGWLDIHTYIRTYMNFLHKNIFFGWIDIRIAHLYYKNFQIHLCV